MFYYKSETFQLFILVKMRPVKKRKDWRRNRELPEKREPREMRSGLLGEKRTLTHAFTLINFSVVTFTTASKYTKSNEVFMMLLDVQCT